MATAERIPTGGIRRRTGQKRLSEKAKSSQVGTAERFAAEFRREVSGWFSPTEIDTKWRCFAAAVALSLSCTGCATLRDTSRDDDQRAAFVQSQVDALAPAEQVNQLPVSSVDAAPPSGIATAETASSTASTIVPAAFVQENPSALSGSTQETAIQGALPPSAPASQQTNPPADRQAGSNEPVVGEPLDRKVPLTLEERLKYNTEMRAQAEQARSDATRLDRSVEADPLNSERLTLADVVASVYQSFPELEQARLQGGVANGELLGAYGSYDTKIYGGTLSEPTGFYKNYRQEIGAARQLWWGGYLAAGYRIGRGDFAPWYKERETDKNGEFKLSLVQPLLQGQAIDPMRVAVFQAGLRQQAVAPEIQRTILDLSLQASLLYWQWVGAGQQLAAQRELLDLALLRGEQLQALVKAGVQPAVDIILNDQLIADRQLKLLESERKYRANAFKLSLFLRDGAGQILQPTDEWLPAQFPRIGDLPDANFDADFAAALDRRPEPQLLNLEIQGIQWDVRLAQNQLLPNLDMVLEGSQDAGDPASSSNDKSRFEMLLGLQGEVPIQRRKARGKIQASQTKIAQLNQKIRLQRDKIATDLLSARNALAIAAESVEQAKLGFEAAIDILNRFQFGFNVGYVDLIYLNILETKANESEIKLIIAQQEWYEALASMQIALGLDPLEQALQVSSLPPADELTMQSLLETLKERELDLKPRDLLPRMNRGRLEPPPGVGAENPAAQQ